MKPLIVHDTEDDWGREIISYLKEKKDAMLQFIDLADKKIITCRGCFQCWTKTPGFCRFSDDMNDILKEQLQSDLVIYLCPLKWGSCSPAMKTFQDRSLCLALPFFRKVNGKTHHPPRYRQSSHTVLAGYGKDLQDDECEVFRFIGEQMSYNLYKAGLNILTVQNHEDLAQLESVLTGGVK